MVRTARPPLRSCDSHMTWSYAAPRLHLALPVRSLTQAMRKSSCTHVTLLSCSIFVTAIVLLGLAIAEIALTAVSLRAFRHFDVQIPGSSLAEWKFISMDPSNIEEGTTTAKYVVGTASLVAALIASLWVALQWRGVREVKVRQNGQVELAKSIR
jgi:hypothetical protein